MKFCRSIQLGDIVISDESNVFIIAEAGVNHNGEMSIAKQLVDAAVNAGADAVKFQYFKTENLILDKIEKAPYQKQTTGATESQFSMLKKLEITQEQNMELMEYCRKKRILFLTTPFDEDSLNELDPLNLPAYKVASTDLTNLPFLKKIAKKNKPMLLSTGMSYMAEIEMALREIHRFNTRVILLQCTANYPADNNEVNLNVIKTYKDKLDILVGFSDHTSGIGASPFAVAMGAKVIEKHFTLNKNLEGPDHRASLSPDELTDFVRYIKTVEEYLGSSVKAPTMSEIETRKTLQKNLVAKRNIKKGEILSEKNVTAKRTGGQGISPINYKNVFGKPAMKDYAKNDIIYE